MYKPQRKNYTLGSKGCVPWQDARTASLPEYEAEPHPNERRADGEMTMRDLIEKKKQGGTHTQEELAFFVRGVTEGSIPDYQTAAWLMAVRFQGMTDSETAMLTQLMAHSGDVTDLSSLGSRTVDKHSTGGVGDKTTLIVAPLAATLGGIVAKMSGRGLGFTGGTVDKLESVPGFQTSMDSTSFLRCAATHGICVIGQSGNLTPADKKLYALRDVTATVDSIPLIASSIMSKKLAAGARSIVLDVKVGSGAFMKTAEQAALLAEKMVAIGKAAGRRMTAVLSDMDTPLGFAVGNSLEVIEAISVLEGKGPQDLTELCVVLASNMLSLALEIPYEEAEEKCRETIASGKAKEKLCEMIAAQGGDASFIEHPEKFPKASHVVKLRSERTGYLSAMDAEKIGLCAGILGAGRVKKEDDIDHTAGLVLAKKTGDLVRAGDMLVTLHTDRSEKIKEATRIFSEALTFAEEPPMRKPLILGVIR